MHILASLGTWFSSKDPNTSINASLSASLIQDKIGTDAKAKWEADKPSIEQRANRAATIALGLIALNLSTILVRGLNRWNIFGIYMGIEIASSEMARHNFYKREGSISMYIDVEDPSIKNKNLLEEAQESQAQCSQELICEVLGATLLVRLVRKCNRWLDS